MSIDDRQRQTRGNFVRTSNIPKETDKDDAEKEDCSDCCSERSKDSIQSGLLLNKLRKSEESDEEDTASVHHTVYDSDINEDNSDNSRSVGESMEDSVADKNVNNEDEEAKINNTELYTQEINTKITRPFVSMDIHN